MASDWIRLRLSDVAIFRNGAGIKQSFFSDKDDAVPLAKVSNFTQDSIDTRNMTKVEAAHASNWNSHKLAANDILIATVGSWPPNWSSVVGKVIRVPNEADGAIQNQNTCCVIPRKDVDQSFLYYVLKSRPFLNYVVNVAQGSANQARVPVKKLGAFSFVAPAKKSEQVKIGRMLEHLDKAIKLNYQTNQTLEQMAQALFKSWFVDFDPVVDNALAAGNPIPDELVHRVEIRKKAKALPDFQPLPEHTRSLFPSEFEQTGEPTIGIGGWVPRGWQVLRADKLASVSIGKTPPRKEKEWFSDIKAGNIIWVSIKDMGGAGVFINESSEYLVSDSINKFNIKVIPKNTVILSFKMTLGRVRITDDEVTTNEAIAHFTKLRLGITSEYLYCQLKAYDFNSLGSTSSIATAVNSKIIKSMPLLVPDESVTGIFSQKVGVLFDRMKALQDNSTQLSKMRDLLLPKLLSGDVTVNDTKECNG